METTAGSGPISLQQPLRQAAGVVLTSPHSGRCYEPSFLAASRLDANAIRRSEDGFVDELFAAGPKLGLPLLAARFPRAYCDANREPWELDPTMFEDPLPDYVNHKSPRVQAGLGTLARIVGTGEPIYAGKLKFAEARARIETCWQPFHAALEEMIHQTLVGFGACLVVDCHSMPSQPARHAPRADVVLGDGHGTSCGAAWVDFIHRQLEAMGLRVERNEPYAGGYITRHYGRPHAGVEVLQLEISRGIYMNERSFTRSARFETTQTHMTQLLRAVVEASPNYGQLGAAAE